MTDKMTLSNNQKKKIQMKKNKQNPFGRAFTIFACDFLGEDPRDHNLTNEEVIFNRREREDLGLTDKENKFNHRIKGELNHG